MPRESETIFEEQNKKLLHKCGFRFSVRPLEHAEKKSRNLEISNLGSKPSISRLLAKKTRYVPRWVSKICETTFVNQLLILFHKCGLFWDPLGTSWKPLKHLLHHPPKSGVFAVQLPKGLEIQTAGREIRSKGSRFQSQGLRLQSARLGIQSRLKIEQESFRIQFGQEGPRIQPPTDSRFSQLDSDCSQEDPGCSQKDKR